MARKERRLPVDDDEYRKALGLSEADELPMQVADWILHDLRRTATTAMADDEKLNIPPHVVDKILNHTSGTHQRRGAHLQSERIHQRASGRAGRLGPLRDGAGAADRE